jgi:hypothetical protein
MFDGVPSSFITSNSDVVGLMNIVGYNDATPELRSGMGGTNLIANLASKADTTALEGLATTEALANATTVAEQVVTTATVATATPGDFDVPKGFIDMNVFVALDGSPFLDSRFPWSNLFDGNPYSRTVFPITPTNKFAFANIDRGENVSVVDSTPNAPKPGLNICSRCTIAMRKKIITLYSE